MRATQRAVDAAARACAGAAAQSPRAVSVACSTRGATRAVSTTAPLLRGSKNLDWYFNALREQELARQAVDAPVFPAEPLHGRRRARAFIDFQTGGRVGGGAGGGADAAPLQRVVVELADDIVPLTVRNFLEVRQAAALRVRVTRIARCARCSVVAR